MLQNRTRSPSATPALNPASIALDYGTRAPGEDWRPVREIIPIARTPCPYGGARPWFACPGCGGRRAVLYGAGGRFRCVACHDLAYSSTREQPRERARRRADRLNSQGASSFRAFGRDGRPLRCRCERLG